MKYHSQNNEAEIVLNYFGKRKGTVLEIGANDGRTFSNSYDLIVNEWYGVLFEPGHIYDELHKLHKGNERVHTHRLGIADKAGFVKFWQSGSHVKNGLDLGLVSTMQEIETFRWKKNGVKFTEIEIQTVPFSWVADKYPIFDFISIDVEGFEWQILRQIDLKAKECKCLCIEWNSDRHAEKLFREYVSKFGMKEIARNAENLIYAI
jgi:FkbM family methyltransferase